MSFPNSHVHIFKNISISFRSLSAMITPPKKIKNVSFAFFNNQSTFSFPHLYKKVFLKICLLKLGNKAQTLAQSKPSSTSSPFSLSLSLYLPIHYHIIFYLNMHKWHVEEVRSAVL